MKYRRPRPDSRLTKAARQELLRAYFDEYRRMAQQQPEALNRKIAREAFAAVLDRIGGLLLEAAAQLAQEPGPVRKFLDANPIPEALHGRLPDDFRAFCLALNALKQWVSAEQAATDRYVLGGTARDECRAASTECVLSGVALEPRDTELHHPLRDGRPPVPVSKRAHALIEGQVSQTDGHG
jgi:hypothetical protein